MNQPRGCEHGRAGPHHFPAKKQYVQGGDRFPLPPPEAVRRARPGVMRMGDLPLAGCSTWESRPSILIGQHSRAGSCVDDGELPCGRDSRIADPSPFWLQHSVS